MASATHTTVVIARITFRQKAEAVTNGLTTRPTGYVVFEAIDICVIELLTLGLCIANVAE